MNKISILLVTVLAFIMSSCGNKTQTQISSADSAKMFEQERIESAIKLHIDSLVEKMAESSYKPLDQMIKSGSITLSGDEIKVKPDYLLAPSVETELTTYAQKYACIVMMYIDRSVAELYKMDVKAYDEALARMATDIDDPTVKMMKDFDGKDYKSLLQNMYKQENEAGRVNYFWIGSCAATIETIYLMSQNVDKFVSGYNDNQIDDITFRIICITDALERLEKYDPQVVGISKAVQPLRKITADTASEFKEQIVGMKAEIEAARNALIE